MIEARGSKVPRHKGRAAAVGKGDTAEGFGMPEGKILGYCRICSVLSHVWSAIRD